VPVTIDGQSVPLTGEIPSGIESYNYFADVTSLVKGKLDAASAGPVAFQYGESEPWNTDGSILEVIYDDPSVTVDQSVTILYGALKSTGDTYDVKLAAPITVEDAAAKLEMSLGISFSYQGNGTQQFSAVDVNGSRLTSAAGGQDDGRAQNGALLTVGVTATPRATPQTHMPRRPTPPLMMSCTTCARSSRTASPTSGLTRTTPHRMTTCSCRHSRPTRR